MKQDIHPTWHDCKVTCTCGATFSVGGTMPEMKVEICSACHPFYTGKQKFIDTAGRLEKFKMRQAKAAASDSAPAKAEEVAA